MEFLKRIDGFGGQYKGFLLLLTTLSTMGLCLVAFLTLAKPILTPHWASVVLLVVAASFLLMSLWLYGIIRNHPRYGPLGPGIITSAILCLTITLFVLGYCWSSLLAGSAIANQNKIIQTTNDGVASSGESGKDVLPTDRIKIPKGVLVVVTCILFASIFVCGLIIDRVVFHQSYWQSYFMRKFPTIHPNQRLELVLHFADGMPNKTNSWDVQSILLDQCEAESARIGEAIETVETEEEGEQLLKDLEAHKLSIDKIRNVPTDGLYLADRGRQSE